MSIALEWGDGNSDQSAFIYFDAVTSYKERYKGKTTDHPIDGGANISDHFVKMNPIFTISGVISGADITVGLEDLKNEDGDSPINTQAAPSSVQVDTNSSATNALLPGSITQLFSPQKPTITFDTNSNIEAIDKVKDAMINLIIGEKYNEISKTFINSMQLLKLYEYEGTVIKRIRENLVMVDLNFDENSDSGDALYCDLVLEQIRFSEGRIAELPSDVIDALKAKAASLENKGKQDSSTSEVDSEDNTDDTALRKFLQKAASE